MSESSPYSDRLKRAALVATITAAGALTVAGCSPSETAGAQAAATQEVPTNQEAPAPVSSENFDALKAKVTDMLATAQGNPSFNVELGSSTVDDFKPDILITETVDSSLPAGGSGSEGVYTLEVNGRPDAPATPDTLDNAIQVKLTMGEDRGGTVRPLYAASLSRTTDGTQQFDVSYLQPVPAGGSEPVTYAASTLDKAVENFTPLTSNEAIAPYADQLKSVYDSMAAGEPVYIVNPVG